jgi:hypothetical protein
MGKNKDTKSSKDSGKDNSSKTDSTKCTGKDAPGLNEHCYRTGYDHSKISREPDAIGEAISAMPCTTNENANRCYGQGIIDGHEWKSARDTAMENKRN